MQSTHNQIKSVILESRKGKVIFSCKGENVNNLANPPMVWQFGGEIQITLSKNSVHYIKIDAKRMDRSEFTELTEEQGLKELANAKKYTPSLNYEGKR